MINAIVVDNDAMVE